VADTAERQLSFGKKLIFLGISGLFGLVLGEGLVRLGFAITGADIAKYEPQFIASRTRELRFVPHPFLPYANRPGDERTIRMENSWPVDGKSYRDIHIRINSLGFRGEEATYERPSGTVRVVCLGGSTTFGSISDGFTWPERLEERLRSRHPGVAFEVLNLGTDGGVSHHDLVNMAFHGVHFQPDLVILYQGTNDRNNWGRSDFRPDYSHSIRGLDELPLSTRLALATPDFIWKSWLVCWGSWQLRRYTGVAPSLRSATMTGDPHTADVDPLYGSYAFLANLRSIRALAREAGAGFVASTFHVYSTRDTTITRLNDEIRRVCTESGIEFVDVAATLPHEDRTLQVDSVHFTARGEEIMAGLFDEYVADRGLLDAAVARARRELGTAGGQQ
jgi:lysophospholipase L1-like esterase